MMMLDLTSHIKQEALSLGADLVGIADCAVLTGLETTPADLLSGFKVAISIAVKLPSAVFEQLVDRPTPLYSSCYQTANQQLDRISFHLSAKIERAGGMALPIPASQPLDMNNYTSHLSAKAVANSAGLGWQGKSLLIITPQFGPRVRLATILTDLPLTPATPLKNRCGSCRNCSDACVAQAIRNVNTEFHYESRDEALDFQKCADKLVNEFKNLAGVDKPICGICIKVCPWGRTLSVRNRAESGTTC
ncbi:MAG: 4Fe-4S double cluster binding domain-containing protein [Desulfuromonadaceae bacterium]|nr:4Fe-4S double cluster binding domain-containing protein [Desulfuromonadaceae bacterium]